MRHALSSRRSLVSCFTVGPNSTLGIVLKGRVVIWFPLTMKVGFCNIQGRDLIVVVVVDGYLSNVGQGPGDMSAFLGIFVLKSSVVDQTQVLHSFTPDFE